jgi:hypothetical protein
MFMRFIYSNCVFCLVRSNTASVNDKRSLHCRIRQVYMDTHYLGKSFIFKILSEVHFGPLKVFLIFYQTNIFFFKQIF